MASYNELNALIDAYINRNGVQAITGQILNGVLKAMVEQLGRGYTIMGAATPTTDPGTPDGPECWFASETGTYTDFDGLQIVPGELALLCYTPTDGFTKVTIYEGFQEVQATIDGNVGTPSVGVSYANGVLSFDFRNMKGNPGDAAGFGTIGADITGGVGTPGVSVETSGDNTAKNLMFHFTNLKGETGVTSVVATIDDTSGTPSCQVSLVGQQLTLAFSGLKGLKGDTGVSADYPITIYNGLDSDATDQALAAAQGKVLDGKISQFQQKVTEIILVLEREDLTENIYYDKQTGEQKTNYALMATKIAIPDGTKTIFANSATYSSSPLVLYGWILFDANDNIIKISNPTIEYKTIQLKNYPSAKKISFSIPKTSSYTFRAIFSSVDYTEGLDNNTITSHLYKNDLGVNGYYDKQTGQFVSNSNLRCGKFDIPADVKTILVRVGNYSSSADVTNGWILFDANDNIVAKGNPDTKFTTINLASFPTATKFSVCTYENASYPILDVIFLNVNYLAQIPAGYVERASMAVDVQDTLSGARGGLWDDTLPHNKAILADFIKDIKITDAKISDKICVWQVYKNYNGDGYYNVVLLYCDDGTYACRKRIKTPYAQMLCTLNRGGTIQMTLDWDAISDGLLSISDRSMAVISNKCYTSSSVYLNDYSEASLRDAIYEQDRKNPFMWKPFGKAYLSWTNDDAVDSTPEYMLVCEKYGVPYCPAIPPEQIDSVNYTYQDPDGNQLMFTNKAILGNEYTMETGGVAFAKLKIYCDSRSTSIGSNVAVTVKKYTNANTYTSETVTLNAIVVGNNYANCIVSSSIVKVGIIVVSSSNGLDKINFALSPYDTVSENVTVGLPTILKRIVFNFGEILAHGMTTINQVDQKDAEVWFNYYCYQGKQLLEEAIGEKCVKGMILVGGTNSNRWAGTVVGQKYMLRNFVYNDGYGITPQYQIHRISSYSMLGSVITYKVPAGLVSIGTLYKVSDVNSRVLEITNDGEFDIVTADYSSNYVCPSTGTVKDSTGATTIANYTDGAWASNEKRKEVFADKFNPVIDDAILNHKWMALFSHEDMPLFILDKMFEMVSGRISLNENISFATWEDVYEENRSSQLEN